MTCSEIKYQFRWAERLAAQAWVLLLFCFASLSILPLPLVLPLTLLFIHVITCSLSSTQSAWDVTGCSNYNYSILWIFWRTWRFLSWQLSKVLLMRMWGFNGAFLCLFVNFNASLYFLQVTRRKSALVYYSGPFRWVGSPWTIGFAPPAQIHLFPAASSKTREQQWCVLQPHRVWGEVTRFSYKYDSNHTNVQTP